MPTPAASSPPPRAADRFPRGSSDLQPPAEAPVSVPLRTGDTVRLEMRDAAGHSIFGAIEQTVA